jgi:hypothetical protein
LLERRETSLCFIARGERQEHADAPHAFRLLRARRERRHSRCSAKSLDEIASSHCLSARSQLRRR